MSGALGHGSFHSVVAGTKQCFRPTFYSSSYELLQLHRAHLDVINSFHRRDKIVDNKFPGCAFANGIFKLGPYKRENYHMRELMEAIRKRSIWMARVSQQRKINDYIISRAKQSLTPAQLEKRFSFHTKDADVYFQPQRYTAANTWPNYWQHPTQNHVVPRPRWRRVPELGHITRVQDSITCPAMDY